MKGMNEMIYRRLKAENLERCVLCHCLTNVPKYKMIQRRSNYVYGVGQLCEKCYQELNGNMYR